MGIEIVLPLDPYWNLDVKDAFDLRTKPTMLDVGQVSDDVDSIRDYIAQTTEVGTVVWHEAEHLSGILRAIGHMDRPRTGSV